MTLHLSAIRHAAHPRSDCRVISRIRQDMTEELRCEIERDRPSLWWPLRIKTNENELRGTGND